MIIKKIKIMGNSFKDEKQGRLHNGITAQSCIDLVDSAIDLPLFNSSNENKNAKQIGKIIDCWYHYGKIYIDIDVDEKYSSDSKKHYLHGNSIAPALKIKKEENIEPVEFIYFYVIPAEESVYNSMTKVRVI